MRLGASDGQSVAGSAEPGRAEVGIRLGTAVGGLLGGTVGAAVGAVLGARLGAIDGTALGTNVGMNVPQVVGPLQLGVARARSDASLRICPSHLEQ